MKNEIINSIYGPAAHSLVDQLDFIVTRETGRSPSNWAAELQENGVQLIVPVAANLDEKSLFEGLNHRLNFRKAVQRATEALSQAGCTQEDCPALWEAASLMCNTPHDDGL